mgnify:CR=1 FL=1
MHFRSRILPADPERIEALVRTTGFFNEEEISIARELVEERLHKGEASGYYFILAEQQVKPQGGLAGYTCYGPIPGTRASFDLYWIAVAPQGQGKGLGKELLGRVEAEVRRMDGSRIYIDTSSRTQYQTTRAFYLACGYHQAADLPEF